MIQASRQGRIQLLPTPDYGRFRRGEAQYDIDQDPVWHYQAKAQPFDAVAFYQCDHLGTPQELTDMNGEIAWAAEYKAWGYAYDALSKAGRQAGLKQPLRFQGQYYDHETGLHYNRHRYYDPHSGRFVSKDPIGLRGGLNTHRYAENPIQLFDPLGLLAVKTYGQWCGPGWTGGHWESYTPKPDGYYLPPIDQVDAACKRHDICYYECRKEHPCEKSKRAECMTRCDRHLGSEMSDLKIPYSQSYANYWATLGWMKFNIFPAPDDNPSICKPEWIPSGPYPSLNELGE
jgi:RHS repeat-associated protein